jgi:hypothetical protein
MSFAPEEIGGSPDSPNRPLFASLSHKNCIDFHNHGERMSSGIENSSVVDLVTHDPGTDEYVVIMIESRPWSNSPQRLDQLLAKINTYVHFIENGDLYRHFPQAEGKPVRIQLDCNAPPAGESDKLITQAQQLLLQRGIDFSVNVIFTRR